jgi:membrane-associated HD superfamily phosphohydrolase
MRRRLSLLTFVTALVVAGVLLISEPAFAAGHALRTRSTVDLGSWPTILAGLCGIGSSQLTALLTHRRAPQWIKSGLHLALSTLAGVLINITVVSGHKWTDYLAEIAVAWITGIGTKVAGGAALAERLTAGQGLGANVAPLVRVPAALPRSGAESTSGT